MRSEHVLAVCVLGVVAIASSLVGRALRPRPVQDPLHLLDCTSDCADALGGSVAGTEISREGRRVRIRIRGHNGTSFSFEVSRQEAVQIANFLVDAAADDRAPVRKTDEL